MDVNAPYKSHFDPKQHDPVRLGAAPAVAEGGRQRSALRRPTSAAALKGPSQSFAAPLRPLTLFEFQEALRELCPSADPGLDLTPPKEGSPTSRASAPPVTLIEDKVRSLVAHLPPEWFHIVEPLRLSSASPEAFVKAALKLKQDQQGLRQGFGLSLSQFQRILRTPQKRNRDEDAPEVERLISLLGPETQTEVRQHFRLRRSMDEFCAAVEKLALHSTPHSSFSPFYLGLIVDSLTDMDSKVPKVAIFDVVQNEVTQKMRFILAEWLFDVSVRFDFSQETIFLALALTDRYLAIQRTSRNEAQLVGLGALLLAAKYEEMYPPAVERFSYMAAYAFTVDDIIRMERQMFVRLQFGVTVATINAVATALLEEQDPRPTETQRYLVHFIGIVMMVSTHLGQYSQASLGAAVVYISRLMLNVPTDEPSAEVMRLARQACTTMSQLGPSAKIGATVYNHFAQQSLHRVSMLPIPASLLDN